MTPHSSTPIDAVLVDVKPIGELFPCGCIATPGDFHPCSDCLADAAAIDADFVVVSTSPAPSGADIGSLIRAFVGTLAATKWGTA